MRSTDKQVVVAGIVVRAGKVLIAKRKLTGSFGGLWEHAGGKVEHGETRVIALQRELHEELGIKVAHKNILFIGSQIFDVPIVSKYTEIYGYEVSNFEGEPVAIVTDELKWVKPEELDKFDGTPAYKGFNKLFRRMLPQ